MHRRVVVADNRRVPATPPHLAAAPAHYENFPVASWLCPPHLRPPIAAIYHFARTADDIADEGTASPDERPWVHGARPQLIVPNLHALCMALGG